MDSAVLGERKRDVVSLRVVGLIFLLSVSLPVCLAHPQPDEPRPNLSAITVDVQTFGRPTADFPTTIQIHSSELDSDLSAISDKPASVSFPNLPPGDYRIIASAPSRNSTDIHLTLAPGQTAKVALIVDRVFPLTLSLAGQFIAAAPAPALPGLSSPDPVTPAPVPAGSPGPSLATASESAARSDSAAVASEPATAPDSSDIPAPAAAPPASDAHFLVAPCTLEEVLPRASANVKQFVDSINRITASEVMAFERRNNKGRLEEKANSKANYVAVIQQNEVGFLAVDEYRNGSPGMTAFEGHIAATGSAALLLIFHPMHLDEFDMACQGRSIWRGFPIYEVNFKQRSDRPNTMSEFRVGGMAYAIDLKGTAFIHADSFQIIHLETELMKPIPQAFLEVERQSVDYGPVAFNVNNDQLWLPQVADITVHFRKKEFNERHTYSDYRLFVVDTGQKISKPTAKAEPAPSPN